MVLNVNLVEYFRYNREKVVERFGIIGLVCYICRVKRLKQRTV
jgi:uncharacterized membrane protein